MMRCTVSEPHFLEPQNPQLVPVTVQTVTIEFDVITQCAMDVVMKTLRFVNDELTTPVDSHRDGEEEPPY